MYTIPRVARLFISPALVLSVFIAGCSQDPDSLISKARHFRGKGEQKAAVIELKNVLQLNPEHAEARYLLGEVYNDMGDFRSADAEFRRALKLNYDRTYIIPALGKSLVRAGEFQKVLDEVNLEGSAPDAVQAEILALRGLASLGLGHIAEARGLFEQALSKRPEFVEALLGQARLAAREKKFDEAARLIDRALASEPKNIDAWMLKGDLSRITANQAAAIMAYQEILRLDAGNVNARLNIVSMHLTGGNLDEARKQIVLARKLAPRNPMTQYMQALLEFQEKNYTAARDAVSQVIKVAPNHIPSLLLAAAIDFALGSHGQAQTHLARVLELVPNNLPARRLLVSSLAKNGQVKRAMDVVQVALKQAPEDLVLLTLAGELYIQNNELEKAAHYFEKASERNPKSPEVRTKLALSRLGAGETDRALSDLESAVQLDSSKYQADIVLVLSHLKRADYEGALKALQTLEAKQPNNPLTYNLKAVAYLGKKDTASAKRELERALGLQPGYVPAAMNLAQLDLQENNREGARRRLENILKNDKNNSQALLALAELGPRIGASQKEQNDWLNRVRIQSPSSVETHLRLARLYARNGDSKQALEIVQQARLTTSDTPQVLELLGALQIATGRKEEGLETYKRLSALQPNSPVVLLRLSMAQAGNGKVEEAAKTLRKALSIKPDFIDAQMSLAGLELRAGNYAEAMRLAKQIQKQAAKSHIGFAIEGDILMVQKKHSEATKAYEAAYAINRNSGLVIQLHRAYELAGKPQMGDARLDQWLKTSPDDANARAYFAEIEIKRGRYKEAIPAYEWLTQKQPDNALLLNNLAWAYHQVKDPRALETAERAYKLRPDQAAVADTLGWILLQQGNTTRALELLRKAATSAPNVPEIRYHLVHAWLKAGDKSQARTELEALLSGGATFSQRTEAQALLKQLRN